MNIAVMSRRRFFTTAFAAAAMSAMPIALTTAATTSTLMLTGCSGNSIEGLINIALASASAILAVAEPGAPWIPTFNQAITTLQEAEAKWKAGGAVTIIEDALNTLEAAAAAIPFTAAYSPLIDVLVAGIEAVLDALPQPTPAPTPAPVSAKAKSTAVLGRVNSAGVVLIKHNIDHKFFMKTKVGVYKDAWQKVVDSNPALAKAKLAA